MNATVPGRWLLANGRSLTLDRPRLIAIINTTPDSFSDGGVLPTVEAALERIRAAIDEGADMLDIGGESTRPGARPVPEDEQIARTEPLVRAVRAVGIEAPISIDTTRARVARAALDAGADAVNDQSAGLDDPAMLPLVAERSAGLVLMHRLRAPSEDRYSNRYDAEPRYDPEQGGVRGVVCAFLLERAQSTENAGIARESVVIDPGLGFGKSVAQNFELIRSAPELLSLGYPILCAASRKSFIGAVSGVTEPAQRVEGSIAVSIAQWAAGVRLFRVHDVAAHRRALGVAEALSQAPDALGTTRPPR